VSISTDEAEAKKQTTSATSLQVQKRSKEEKACRISVNGYMVVE
jgi:hypothetical protein